MPLKSEAHTAFGHVTTDPPPGASLGEYCIVNVQSLNKISQAVIQVMCVDVPQILAFTPPPTFGHVTQDLNLPLVSHMVRY